MYINSSIFSEKNNNQYIIYTQSFAMDYPVPYAINDVEKDDEIESHDEIESEDENFFIRKLRCDAFLFESSYSKRLERSLF